MIGRASKVWLCNDITFDRNYKHVCDIDNDRMYNLITQHAKYYYENLSFVSAEKSYITIEESYINLLDVNYLAFQNANYSNKMFYAFVDKIEYLNNKATRIYFTIDIWQTWARECQGSMCFVIREHILNDAIGANKMEEHLDLGDYYCQTSKYSSIWESVQEDFYVIMQTTGKFDSNGNIRANPQFFNSIPSALNYYAFDCTTEGLAELQDTIQVIVNKGQTNTIVGLFLAPKKFCGARGLDYSLSSNFGATRLIDSMPYINNFFGYSPKNKKLLQYPYCYHLITNGQGASALIRPEKFKVKDQAHQFSISGAVCPGCSIICCPQDYNNYLYSYNDSIQAGKFPQVAWAGDAYTNWLVNNGISLANSLFQSQSKLVKGSIKGDVEDVIDSAFSIAQSMRESELAELLPPQFGGNINSGDVMFSINNLNIMYSNMSIDAEHAMAIDDYFTKFGYATNQLKEPNLTGRPFWNYVQISSDDTYYKSGATADVLEELNNILRSGVTIWHDYNSMYDYEQDNSTK